MSVINKWMGEMYCDHQLIDVIEKMTYSDLQYWHGWHEAMQGAWKSVSDGIKGKKK